MYFLKCQIMETVSCKEIKKRGNSLWTWVKVGFMEKG